MRRIAVQWLAFFLLAALLAIPLFGGGIELYELGTPDVGLASAGYAARAEDASTLFKNPAGMSRMESSEFQLGTQLLYADVQFKSNGSTTTSGGDGGNPVGLFPGGGLFFVYKPTEKLGLGLGTFSYFGLAQKFDSDWVGRYYYQEGGLAGITFMPAASYRLFDWLSIGAGMNAMYGVFSQKVAINNIVGPDGQLALEDSTWGFGANAGVLIEPLKGTRFGVTYLSPVKLDFKDDPKFTGLSSGMQTILGAAGLLNSSIGLGMTVPQSVMVSAYQELGERWALMADFGWQQWSEFGKIDVAVTSDHPVSLTANRKYQDTFHGAIGTRFRFLPDWAATLGFAYDSSAVEDKDRTVDFAVGKAYRIGAGIQWKVAESVDLGAAYELMWAGDMPVDQQKGPLAGRVSGEFSNTAMHFFALNLGWRF